jgi:hypothetical protein
MKYLMNVVFAAAIALAGATAAAHAQAPKPPTPAAVGYAKEILALKSANAMYASIVPNIVQKTMQTLVQNNLNYQKDLGEVAEGIAKNMAGRVKEIDDGMAKVYAADFTEQELKDLVTFYKSPLGQKLLTLEPRAIAASMGYVNEWAQTFSEEVNGQFRAEMRKRGKEI